MNKKILFGAIASILTTIAFADPVTITTQDYVDTALETKQDTIPAGSFGANNSVVTYDANSGDVQERFILHPATPLTEDRISLFTSIGRLLNGDVVVDSYKTRLGLTDEQFGDALLPAKYIVNAFGREQDKITPGTTGSVAIFNGSLPNNGGAAFTERAIYDGSTTYDSTTDADKLITAGAVDNKQNKMTCTRWLDDAEHTDANCLLWDLSN